MSLFVPFREASYIEYTEYVMILRTITIYDYYDTIVSIIEFEQSRMIDVIIYSEICSRYMN